MSKLTFGDEGVRSPDQTRYVLLEPQVDRLYWVRFPQWLPGALTAGECPWSTG